MSVKQECGEGEEGVKHDVGGYVDDVIATERESAGSSLYRYGSFPVSTRGIGVQRDLSVLVLEREKVLKKNLVAVHGLSPSLELMEYVLEIVKKVFPGEAQDAFDAIRAAAKVVCDNKDGVTQVALYVAFVFAMHHKVEEKRRSFNECLSAIRFSKGQVRFEHVHSWVDNPYVERMPQKKRVRWLTDQQRARFSALKQLVRLVLQNNGDFIVHTRTTKKGGGSRTRFQMSSWDPTSRRTLSLSELGELVNSASASQREHLAGFHEDPACVAWRLARDEAQAKDDAVATDEEESPIPSWISDSSPPSSPEKPERFPWDLSPPSSPAWNDACDLGDEVEDLKAEKEDLKVEVAYLKAETKEAKERFNFDLSCDVLQIKVEKVKLEAEKELFRKELTTLEAEKEKFEAEKELFRKELTTLEAEKETIVEILGGVIKSLT